MRFISPKTDFAFKKIFGSDRSKDILISFLNAIIYSGDSIIHDLEIIDPYNAGDVSVLKDSYLDVKAVLADKTTVIIEMQVSNVEAFEKRVVYNLCKSYGNQLDSGQAYYELTPIIALTITDFKLFSSTTKVINRFCFQEEEEHFGYQENELRIVFVELPKFTKNLEELESITDKWIYFIKEAPSLEVIPEKMRQVPQIEQALNIANQADLTVKELEKVHRQEMFWQDRRGALRFARKEGREEGREEGKEEGIRQEKIAIARSCKQRGLDVETIIEITQLSREEIESL